MASQYRLEAYGKVPRIRCTMQVWTIAAGKTPFTLSGSPLRPSQTMKNTSAMPRFFSSVSTLIQNFADSPLPLPGHSPSTSRCPARSTPIAA